MDVVTFAEDPYSDDNLTDPYPLFQRMQDAGPAVWLEKYDVMAFTRYEECRRILEDHRTFVSGAGVGPKNLKHEPAWRTQGILELDPPDHTVLRTAMTDVISPRGVRSLRTRFTAAADGILDSVLRRGRFDGVTDLAEPYPLMAFGDAVGIPREGRADNLIAHGAMNFSAFGPDDERSAQYFARGAGTHDWVMANCARENLKVGGLGWQVWEHADAGTISAEQATLLVRAMLSAGLDTTVIAIGNTLACLAGDPDVWSRLHEDPSLMKFAIDEAFRLESPFQSFYRTTSEDTSIGGVDLPADTKVLLFMGAANRDPRYWGDDAHLFDLDRRSGGHLAFGMGIHQCVGQPVSRLEMDVLLTELAHRAGRLEFDGTPEPLLHNTLRGWNSLPIHVEVDRTSSRAAA